MFEKYFKDVLDMTPSFASFLGDRSRDDRVEIAISPAFRSKYKALLKKYETSFRKYRPRTFDENIDAMLLGYTLIKERESLVYPYHYMPISSFDNMVTEFTFIDTTMYPKDTKKQLQRHKCYIDIMKQAIVNMRKGIKTGYVLPKIICHRIIDDIETFLEKKAYMINPKLKHFFEHEYRPQISDFLYFLKHTYLQHCRDTIGIYDVPHGKEMYMDMLISSTTLRITPEEIHELGLQEVKRILDEFSQLIPVLRPDDNDIDVITFIHKVKEDPKYYLKTPNDIVEAFKKKQEEIRDTVLKDNFYDIVKPYQIRKVPKVMQNSSAGAFYYPGNNVRPGIFYINTRDVKENPIYTIETLTIHEGEPGHHYQFQYMLDKQLPMYRIFGVDGDAFAEGWALYTESLSTSKNPSTQFGRLTYEMFRAVRCVVDTGIHYYGWSYDKAFEYMKQYIAMKDSEIETELYRYICIPGQATSYKVGEQFFLRQRQRYLRAHPGKIKDFHQLVLENGVLPFDVLEKIINASVKR